MKRVEKVFRGVLRAVRQRLPWVPALSAAPCRQADLEHKESWRQFAHQGHVEGAICFAGAAGDELTLEELIGLSAHELGHVVAEKIGLPAHRKQVKDGKTPKAVQDEADGVSELLFHIPLRYNEREIQVPNWTRISGEKLRPFRRKGS